MFFKTKNFDRSQSLCELAQKSARRGILEGDSGHGKTFSLEHYFRSNTKVIYIRCTSSMKTIDMLIRIAKSLWIELPDKPKEHALMQLIESKLTGEPGWLIIFDETEDLPVRLWFAIKEIEDFTRGKCGLIVSGLGIKDKITKLAAKGKPGFPQIKRRLFANIVSLQPITAAEVRQLCKSNGLTNPDALGWFAQNVGDYDMLNQYLSDLVSAYDGDIAGLDGKQVAEFFNL